MIFQVVVQLPLRLATVLIHSTLCFVLLRLQRVVDKKRRLLISWAPTTQLPPTAIPVDSQPALEFYSPSGIKALRTNQH